MRTHLVTAITALLALGACESAPVSFAPLSDASPDVTRSDVAPVPDATPSTDAGLSSDVSASTDDVPASRFTATPFGAGAPTWRVERVWTVSAPFGYRADDTPWWSLFHDSFAAPNHAYAPRVDQIAHLRPHDGPYDREVDLALARAGRTPREVFSAREFFAPTAVYIVVLLAPTESAPRGRTPDGDARLMIPNEAFPIRFDGRIYRDGSLYDENPGSSLDAPTVAFAGAWEGHTHAFYVLAEDSEFAPPTAPIEGRFEWRPTIVDATSRGYRVTIPFEVRCTDADRDVPNCTRAFDAGAPDMLPADVSPTDVASADDVTADVKPPTDVSPPSPGAIGAACASDVDCGPGGLCITRLDSLVFPGGYCTRPCATPGNRCSDDGADACVSIDLGRSAPAYCLRLCSAGCRDGYRCLPLLPSSPVCLVP